MSRAPFAKAPGLADILGHPEYNGLYRLPDGLAVSGAIEIPGATLTGKSAMLDALAKALAFPDYFGGNWDAMEECLSDLSWHPGPVAILIDAAEILETKSPNEWAVLLDMLADVAHYWKMENRPFAVFLRGNHAAYPIVTA